MLNVQHIHRRFYRGAKMRSSGSVCREERSNQTFSMQSSLPRNVLWRRKVGVLIRLSGVEIRSYNMFQCSETTQLLSTFNMLDTVIPCRLFSKNCEISTVRLLICNILYLIYVILNKHIFTWIWRHNQLQALHF